MFRYVLIEIYKVKAGIKDLSSERSYFILRDTVEAVKRFHWDTVLMEFEKMLMEFEKMLPTTGPETTKIEHIFELS